MSKTFQSELKNTGNERGFTLLEVIMAVSILTVGLLAVASMQVSAMRGNTISMTYTESTEMVQDRVEKLLIQDLSNADLTDTDGDGVNGLDHTGANADRVDASNPKYTVNWNVVENWSGGKVLNGVNTIRVIVTWQGDNKRYSFDMLKNRIKS